MARTIDALISTEQKKSSTSPYVKFEYDNISNTFSYLTGGDAAIDIGGVDLVGQTFTNGSTAVRGKYLRALLYRVGSPGIVQLEIFATTAGVPTGSALATGYINGDILTTGTNGGWYIIPFTEYEFAANTQYAVTLTAADGDAIGTNCIYWVYDTSSAAFDGGTLVRSTDDGANWSAVSGDDCIFEIYTANWVDDTDRFISMEYFIYPYSGESKILLDNSDGYYNDFSDVGQDTRLSVGFETPAGVKTVALPYHWILNYRFISSMGSSTLQLNCQSVWAKIVEWVSDEDSYWISTKTIKELLDYVLTDKINVKLGTSISEDSRVDAAAWNPIFSLSGGKSGLACVQELLAYTDCALVPRDNTLVLKHNQSSDTSDYTFYIPTRDGQHSAWEYIKQNSTYKNNQVTVLYGDGLLETYMDTSQSIMYPRTVPAFSIATAANALAMAKSITERNALGKEVGALYAPPELSLEIYDKITVKDSRNGKLIDDTERIGSMYYRFKKNIGSKHDYAMSIGLGGGVFESYIVPMDDIEQPEEVVDPNFKIPEVNLSDVLTAEELRDVERKLGDDLISAIEPNKKRTTPIVRTTTDFNADLWGKGG